MAHLPADMRSLPDNEARFILRHSRRFKADLSHYDEVSSDELRELQALLDVEGVDLLDLLVPDASRVLGRHRGCGIKAYFAISANGIEPLTKYPLPRACGRCAEREEALRAERERRAAVTTQPKRRRRFSL